MKFSTPGLRAQRPLRVESLEDRRLMALNPSGFEQEMLELINDMRENPDEHLGRLVSSIDPLVSPDADVQSALNFFGVDGAMLAEQWEDLVAAPPLAWHEALMDAAEGHNQEMLEHDEQSHQLPGEPSLSARVEAAGYTNWTAVAENVFAYTESVFHGHAGFAIDWGNGPGGMQSPPGHRNAIMSTNYREIGISVIESTPGKDVGPYLVTQDFGNRSSGAYGNPYLLGVVYSDDSGDGFYQAGEGQGGVTVTATGTGGAFMTTTMTAGGYQMKLPAGTYSIEFSGGGVGTIDGGDVTIGSSNVKVDSIVGATLDLTIDPATVAEGGTITGTVTRTGSTTNELTVNLSSSDTGEATVPNTVTILAGQASATFDITGVFDGITDGTQTVDIAASAAGFGGETVEIMVTDGLPAGFNLVGDTLTVTGTNGDDTFGFQAGTMHEVTLNGTTAMFDAAEVSNFFFDGGAGDDVATLRGDANHEESLVQDDNTRMTGSGFYVETDSMMSTGVLDTGANDLVKMYGVSNSSDMLFTSGNLARLSGSGYTNETQGAAKVNVFGRSGTDTVEMHGTDNLASRDVAVARFDKMRLLNTNYDITAFDFEGGEMFGGTGEDKIKFYGTDVAETYVDTPTQASLSGGGMEMVVEEFTIRKVLAEGAGDTAELFGSDSIENVFVGKAEFARLQYNENVAIVFDMASVVGYGNITDKARLHGSTGNDSLSTFADQSQLSGAGFSVTARGFGQIRVYGEGGTDSAVMNDTPGDRDDVTVKADWTRMSRDSSFEVVFDFSTVQVVTVDNFEDTIDYREAISYVVEEVGDWLHI